VKYLIVLDANSTVGKIYSVACDYFVKVEEVTHFEEVKHPVLVCTEIETDNPNYIFARRPLKEGATHQSLYLPHGSVAMILQIEEDQPIPIGFVLSQ
jgi:hypothetical protein